MEGPEDSMMSRQSSLKAMSFLAAGPKFHESSFNAAPGTAKDLAAQRVPRKRIWDLNTHYHCSIVGTCLSTAELRKLLVKLDLASANDSDHDLHGRGVGLAAKQDMAGKLLNKMLDDRHQVTIKRYGRARTEPELRALWLADVKAGDIPGGYWAAMTHPAATHALAREAFGYVHMLSHLVGAANRADIRRLQQLESENAAMAEKIARQQAQIRDITVARDATIRQLQRELSDRIAGETIVTPMAAGESSFDDVIADVRRQAAAEFHRRGLAEERLARARNEVAQAQAAALAAERRALALQAELDAVERSLQTTVEMTAEMSGDAAMTLDGLTVLYVGGRPTQMPHIRQAAAARGGKLLHHDGGVEDNDLILASMVSRADIIFFPVDCVSHGAVGTVKRTCRNAGKKYVPLRSAAVTSFIAGLCA
jgi:hypothetical protein